MNKKQAPTFSQLSYIVTGILAAHVQRGDELSQTVIEKAVFVTSNRRISEIFHDSLEKGYLMKNSLTGKYRHSEP